MLLQVWPRVKAANPHLSSVCELGAIVGSMWRDLNPTDKQCYNDQFTRDKVSVIFYARKQLLLWHALAIAIAILSVCLSARHTGGSVKNGAS